MKKIALTIMATFVLSLLSVGAFAHDKDKMLKEHVDFNNDIMVGATHVKKGTYLIKYDTDSGVLTIMTGSKHDKVVATAKATVTMSEKDFPNDALLTRTTNGHEMLTGIRLGGQKEEITITDSVASSQDE